MFILWDTDNGRAYPCDKPPGEGEAKHAHYAMSYHNCFNN